MATSNTTISATDIAPVVGLRDLRFRWGPQHPDVLDIAELQVPPGTRQFIAGESGSGKSTLLSLLAGVVIPQAGELEVLGQSPATMPPARRDRFRADHVGFIFQLFNLIPYLSVIDNVILPLQFSPLRRSAVAARRASPVAEARRLLADLGLAAEPLLQRPVTELSVGQQQRVAAARALIGAPRLLIADEPTSALDHAHRAAFIDLLFRECDEQGTTLLFVSHDRTLGTLFDRLVDMADINRARPQAA